MTITPEHRAGEPHLELVSVREDLVGLAQTLQRAGEQLRHVRAAALPMDESTAIETSGLLESIDAEAERLRALLERRPLEAGCDPMHDAVLDVAPPPAGAAFEKLAPHGELLTRLDALDDVLDPARTFRAGMHGDDVLAWQRHVNHRLRDWRIAYRIGVDGEYGSETANWSKRVLYGLGLSIADWDGLTPQARIKARHPETRSAAELGAARSRRRWLRRLRRRHAAHRVHTPVEKIITSSNGFSAGHDGIDLICPANARIFAVCRARVIDVRSGGWWGKNPTGDVSIGDGIIQLEALESIGPLKQGMHIGYGHAERAQVRVGQTVKAGDVLGRAGFANAWHIHFMINDGSTSRGIGNINPRSCLDLFTRRTSP